MTHANSASNDSERSIGGKLSGNDCLFVPCDWLATRAGFTSPPKRAGIGSRLMLIMSFQFGYYLMPPGLAVKVQMSIS